MRTAIGSPTKADRARFDAFRRIGCVACRKEGYGPHDADVHHLLSGGHRRGHRFTVPLCPWHHRGFTYHGSRQDMTDEYGPSLAHQPRRFRERYGSDDELLAYTDQLIEASRNGCR